jgi:BASS family bile acid:Na+ symporter
MDVREAPVDRLARFVHAHFLWLIACSYAVAACFPSFGLWIRDVRLGDVIFGGTKAPVSLSMLMLGFLLLNAGLGVEPGKIREMVRTPKVLAAGLVANLFVPIACIFLVARTLAAVWHNADEAQNIIVGLALVASMPIAGSSTAWAQNAGGELTLSLGMVVASTLLSPLTTPLALHAVGLMASRDYAHALHELAAGGTGIFLTLCVLAPSLVGIGVRRAVGDAGYIAVRARLKLLNSVVLLALNYSNAAVSLPQAVLDPDLDFLVATLGIVVGLCALAFAAGWAIARLLKVSPSQRAALMFGLGMNNNGSGLVLASMAMGNHPQVMLPIIFYNLVQHLVAGIVDRLASRGLSRSTESAQDCPLCDPLGSLGGSGLPPGAR